MLLLDDIKLDAVNDCADRSTEIMSELGAAERDLARRVIGILNGHMFAAIDRERTRQALRALSFCAAAMIAATGPVNAGKVLDAYERSIKDLVRQMLGV